MTIHWIDLKDGHIRIDIGNMSVHFNDKEAAQAFLSQLVKDWQGIE